MSVYLGRYEFEGPHESIDQLENREGVVAVVCLNNGHPHQVLLLQQTNNIHANIRNHIESATWKKKCAGSIGFYVNYTPNLQKPGREMIVHDILNTIR